MPNQNVVTFKIGGTAGDGQQVAGTLLAKACARAGLFTFDGAEFPSLIRGGHVTFAISIAQRPITALYETTDVLVALNTETLTRHIAELSPNAIIIYDQTAVKTPPDGLQSRLVVALPMADILKAAGAIPQARNIVATGAAVYALGLDVKLVSSILSDIFGAKGVAVIETNQRALQAGYDYARDNLKQQFTQLPSVAVEQPRLVVSGNEAMALSAIASGCKFHAHYPMSPSTSLLQALIDWQDKSGMVIRQPEDEIAAINMAVGASFAGARAMTSSSGGGFALMVEGLALAGMTETPLVIVVAQRPGPATGLPTWTEQGDLRFVIHAGHGDFPRIVLAPGDVTEAFNLGAQAFNLAEQYQLPVIILLDKYLAEGHQTVDQFETKQLTIDRGQLLTDQQLQEHQPFKRYQLSADGISPRSIPGQAGGVHLANSDEHDERGFSIEGWEPELRIAQQDKRMKKIQTLLAKKVLPAPTLYGPKKAAVTVIGWGSIKGPMLEALQQLPTVNYLHYSAVFPLDGEEIKRQLKNTQRVMVIENNYSGQFAGLIAQYGGIQAEQVLKKYSGRQWFPEEIVAALKKYL